MEYRDVKQHIVAKSWNIRMQNINEYQSQETSAYKKILHPKIRKHPVINRHLQQKSRNIPI